MKFLPTQRCAWQLFSLSCISLPECSVLKEELVDLAIINDRKITHGFTALTIALFGNDGMCYHMVTNCKPAILLVNFYMSLRVYVYVIIVVERLCVIFHFYLYMYGAHKI